MVSVRDAISSRRFGEFPTHQDIQERVWNVFDTLHASNGPYEVYELFAKVLEGSSNWFIIDDASHIMKTARSAEERLAGIGLTLFQPTLGPQQPFPSIEEFDEATGLPGQHLARELPELIRHELLLVRLPLWPTQPKTLPREKRPAIPKELRWRVWQRDNFTCKRCGAREYLSIDHIRPVSLGGETVFDNLQTLCERCNSSKGARVE